MLIIILIIIINFNNGDDDNNNNNDNNSFVHLPLMVNLPRAVSIVVVLFADCISLGYVVRTEVSS